MFKRFLLSTLALAGLLSAAIAQTGGSGGQGAGFPTVGIPADTQCIRYGNNNVCNAYAPAGPTTVTGAETVMSDTHLPSGQAPVTVNMPITAIGGGKLSVQAPLTGATIAVDAQTRQLIVNPAGTIAALTVNLPAASSTTPYDGQRIGLCGTQIVTALTMGAGTGNSFGSTVTSQAMLVPVVTGAASCMEWIYSKTSSTAGVWFRTQ